MFIDALLLASLTTAGFMFVYKKLPRGVRKFLEKHALLTDAVALLLTYGLLGGTLTALMAGALVGIFTSIMLYIAEHPDDFQYLWDAAEAIKKFTKQLQVWANETGAAYREHKDASTPVKE
jgi:hypothetical protein